MQYKFKVFTNPQKEVGQKALKNLKDFCEEYIPDNYSIEIVDIFNSPEKAFENKIFASPTIVRETPQPEKRVIGSLSNKEKAKEIILSD